MKNININARPNLSSRPVQIAAGVLVAVVLFGAGFAAGASRTPSPSTAATASANPSGGARGGGGGATGRGVVNGQILSVNADSITIQLRQGGQNGASATTTSQIVLVGSATRVVKTQETDIKLSDLKVGDVITVAGTPDTSTGTLSATAIVGGGTNILGDIFGGGGAGGTPRASGSPRPSPTR